jgi:hypothetical protein
MHHPQWIAAACARVMARSRSKAAGVDGITVGKFERTLPTALETLRLELKRGFTWVIEGDVKACFDEISHRSILGALREKVMDNKFLDLTTRFLKAGVMIDGKLQPTEKGVPQGGVFTPPTILQNSP